MPEYHSVDRFVTNATGNRNLPPDALKCLAASYSFWDGNFLATRVREQIVTPENYPDRLSGRDAADIIETILANTSEDTEHFIQNDAVLTNVVEMEREKRRRGLE
jgi:hypothetical protein